MPSTAFAFVQQGGNPLAGKRLYVDPNSNAKRQAETMRRSRPQDAALLAQIADKPVAKWLGGWVGDIGREVESAVSTITGSGSLPIFVAHNIPGRDCGQYSAGGANGGDAYRMWNTGHPLVDAFLWIKQHGESDGTCQGGPRAGSWWTEIALELSRAASTLSRTVGR